jgi:MFS family permease
MSLTSMVVAPFAGRLADRFNGKYILFVGLSLFALGMGLVIWVASLTAQGTTFTPALIVAGFGMGCTFAPLVTMAMRDIVPSEAGAASGFINTIRQVGGALGTAVVGALLQNQLAGYMHSEAVRYSATLPSRFRPQFIAGFSHAAKGGFQIGRGQTGASTHLPAGVPPAVAHQIGALSQTVFHHAYLLAMKPTLAVNIVLMAVGALIVLLMRGGRRQAAEVREEKPSGGIAAAGQ